MRLAVSRSILRRMRLFFSVLLTLSALTACGSAEPEAEATWETHTTAEDSSGGEQSEAE